MRYGQCNTSSAFFQIYTKWVAAVTSLPTLWERGTRTTQKDTYTALALFFLCPLVPNQKSNVTDFSATRKYLD
jgi:hypothetical protein